MSLLPAIQSSARQTIHVVWLSFSRYRIISFGFNSPPSSLVLTGRGKIWLWSELTIKSISSYFSGQSDVLFWGYAYILVTITEQRWHLNHTTFRSSLVNYAASYCCCNVGYLYVALRILMNWGLSFCWSYHKLIISGHLTLKHFTIGESFFSFVSSSHFLRFSKEQISFISFFSSASFIVIFILE